MARFKQFRNNYNGEKIKALYNFRNVFRWCQDGGEMICKFTSRSKNLSPSDPLDAYSDVYGEQPR